MAECLRQTVPNRWTGVRKRSLTNVLCVYVVDSALRFQLLLTAGTVFSGVISFSPKTERARKDGVDRTWTCWSISPDVSTSGESDLARAKHADLFDFEMF